MDIVDATRRFEAWLRRHGNISARDLDYKHAQMRSGAFPFFRATFYRWAQLWPLHCAHLAELKPVNAVGDLHVENFGTWRDTEGRLVWGVNDFDEAHPMAFANDLVRLAVSAFLAAEESPRFALRAEEICELLEEGYRHTIEVGAFPFVLMEGHPELRKMAVQDLRQPAVFWGRLEQKLGPPRSDVPNVVKKVARKTLPCGAEPKFHVLKMPKGLGSLGRQRFIAIVDWEGGFVAREMKAVLPSACNWAAGRRCESSNPWLMKTVKAAVRCTDPFYEVRRDWLVRRLAPDCSRIDINELVHHEDIASLLRCMGRETANIHLGTPKGRKRIRAALERLPKHWLLSAAQAMEKASLKDFRLFRKASRKKLAV